MASSSKQFPNTIILFDVDGTLTKSRLPITEDMKEFLRKLQKKVDIGLVGGSDLAKIAEQMTVIEGDNSINNKEEQINDLINEYDYVFAENGLVAYHNGKSIGKESILNRLGEEFCQRIINFVLGYFSKLILPCKRGNFVEFRNGLINFCPIGRSCSQQEREQFARYDQENQVRLKFVEELKKEFGNEDINFAIGGQISVDCFPNGWDKRFCLKFLTEKYDKIYFFGDRTQPGGNDHEIFQDPSTIGYSVDCPDHTKQLLTEMFF